MKTNLTGTTWRGIKRKVIAFIWIDELNNRQIWRWSVSDGMETKTDYTFSLYTCKRDMPFAGRMKRVKQINDLIE